MQAQPVCDLGYIRGVKVMAKFWYYLEGATMRLYEFECHKCGERFSFYSRLPELVREIKCPKCGGEKPEQKYASPEPSQARADTYSSGGST